MWWPYILIGVVLVLVVGVFAMVNHLRTLRNDCKDAYSTMDVFLKNRYDLIPALGFIVQSFAARESQALEMLLEARNGAVSAGTVTEKMNAERRLTGAIAHIVFLAESYPEMKASADFLSLQGDFRAVELDIANARKNYNHAVNEYNHHCQQQPAAAIARIFGYKRIAAFEGDRAQEEPETV